MSYHREVLSPRVEPRPRRFHRGFIVSLAISWLLAVGYYVYDQGRDRGDIRESIDSMVRKIQRLEHDVYWCGQRIDSLRTRGRPVHFIASPTGGATE